MESVRPG